MAEMFRPKNAEEQRIYMLGVVYGQEEAEAKIERLIKAGDELRHIIIGEFGGGSNALTVDEVKDWEEAKQ